MFGRRIWGSISPKFLPPVCCCRAAPLGLFVDVDSHDGGRRRGRLRGDSAARRGSRLQEGETRRRALRVQLKQRRVLCEVGRGRVSRLHPLRQRRHLADEVVELGCGGGVLLLGRSHGGGDLLLHDGGALPGRQIGLGLVDRTER